MDTTAIKLKISLGAIRDHPGIIALPLEPTSTDVLKNGLEEKALAEVSLIKGKSLQRISCHGYRIITVHGPV